MLCEPLKYWTFRLERCLMNCMRVICDILVVRPFQETRKFLEYWTAGVEASALLVLKLTWVGITH